MIGFDYTFKTSEEILASWARISSMWFNDIFLVLIFLWLTWATIFIFLPAYIIAYKHMKDKKEKINKKKLLTQILLQKELEDEVEKEIELEEKK